MNEGTRLNEGTLQGKMQQYVGNVVPIATFVEEPLTIIAQAIRGPLDFYSTSPTRRWDEIHPPLIQDDKSEQGWTSQSKDGQAYKARMTLDDKLCR